jgi:hypothetical protein
MNKIEKLNLIEGEFSSHEAKEVLLNIFSTKINFHEMKNFSSQERFGKKNEISQKRIPKLKKSVEKMHKIIEKAIAKNRKLIITSEICIRLSDE